MRTEPNLGGGRNRLNSEITNWISAKISFDRSRSDAGSLRNSSISSWAWSPDQPKSANRDRAALAPCSILRPISPFGSVRSTLTAGARLTSNRLFRGLTSFWCDAKIAQIYVNRVLLAGMAARSARALAWLASLAAFMRVRAEALSVKQQLLIIKRRSAGETRI